MKTIKAYTYLLLGIALSLMCACSEETFSPNNVAEGENVTLTLSYSDVSPREITVSSRATEQEERHLNNLYIYIFDGSGKLKGFKEITSEDKLDQNTSSTSRATISGIKTKTGASYIYAVANINTGLYPVTCSEGSVADGKLPVGLNEDKAQAGEYASFTLDKLKALSFTRSESTSIQISSAFLMSGAVNEGKEVTINENGTIDGNNTDNDIRLSRIVSKVKFTIKAKTGDGVTRSFKLATYDIMNIAMNGSLVGTIDGNTRKEISGTDNISNIIGLTRGVNDVDSEGREFFEVYLPENLQTAKANVTSQEMREDDSQTTEKAFTNAPEYGTYVVLKGRYEETSNGSTKSADVRYYVHLGDCSTNVNDYNVDRNCQYTFNVTVAGVDKIIVEAKKEGNEQPGAEGVVLEFGNIGKNMLLDSHYEYMVMRFYQNDIKKLRESGLGYYYQVYELGKHTDVINVKDDNPTGNKNGVSTDWIQFAIKNGNSTSEYSSSATERGTACDYPNRNDIDKKDDGTGLYSIEKFLKLLYDKAETDNFWTGNDNSKGKYIDATCFVDENYYKDLTWDQYVNDVERRKFYVANTVATSTDGRSVYAQAQYGLSQYNIQTFYNRSQSGTVTAYGCETTNDEEGKGFTANGDGDQYQSYGSDSWNGRSNMLKDIFKTSQGTTSPRYTWEQLKSNTALVKACMSRNRDLNGDGKISEDEVRWYAPTMQQYAGLWIGEEILSTESKLYNRSTATLVKDPDDRMLYYTSTKGTNTFFSEEGMATNNYTGSGSYPPTYIRCIRNLKSNNEGYNETPDKFYTYTSSDSKVTLDKVDSNALNVTGEQNELTTHTERSDGNKPAQAFYIANSTHSSKKGDKITSTQANVVNGYFKCNGSYSQDGTNWRVPNQREMSLMVLINTDLVKDTYCRTIFSNTNFRKSWTYSSVFTMTDKWNTKGSVRCIKVAK